MKICSNKNCEFAGIEQSILNFGKNKRNKDNLLNYCKFCKAGHDKKYRNKN